MGSDAARLPDLPHPVSRALRERAQTGSAPGARALHESSSTRLVAATSPTHAPAPRRKAARDEDAALIRRLLLRDGRAWHAFYQRYEPIARKAIQKVTQRFRLCRERVDVEEIRSALFCGLIEGDMRKLRSFDPDRGPLDGFLRLLATHAAWSYLRVRARQSRGVSSEEDLDVLLAPQSDPLQALDLKRRTLRVQNDLRALPQADQMLIALLYLEGVSAEQAAAALGVTVETVYTKKSRIQGRLRRALSRETREVGEVIRRSPLL